MQVPLGILSKFSTHNYSFLPSIKASSFYKRVIIIIMAERIHYHTHIACHV